MRYTKCNYRLVRTMVWERNIQGKGYRFEAYRNRLDNGDWYEYVHVFFLDRNGISRATRPHRRFARCISADELMRKIVDA